MAKLVVHTRRTQYAVGHGGFHCGDIGVSIKNIDNSNWPTEPPDKQFFYIYDCGSEKQKLLRAALKGYEKRSSGQTEIIFVSHLHADHINGIDSLQTISPARVAVVPYLDVLDRLVFLLGDIDAAKATFSTYEYFRDPVNWWQQRGTQSIVFLTPGNGQDTPPGGREPPDGPRLRTELGLSKDDQPLDGTLRARIASHLVPPGGPTPAGITRADPTARDIPPGAFLAGSGSSFQLEWSPNHYLPWRSGSWALVPYVHPIKSTARQRFRSAVLKQIGQRNSNNLQLATALVDYLRVYKNRKILTGLYSELISRSQNNISMSLYSGPLVVSPSLRDQGKAPDPSPWWSNYLGTGKASLSYNQHPFGWLSTGDSALKESERRGPWLDFFRPFTCEIGILTLPHHGSSYNFHEEILDFSGLRFALATTIEGRNKVAGARNTLQTVRASNISALFVDDKIENTVECATYHCYDI